MTKLALRVDVCICTCMCRAWACRCRRASACAPSARSSRSPRLTSVFSTYCLCLHSPLIFSFLFISLGSRARRNDPRRRRDLLPAASALEHAVPRPVRRAHQRTPARRRPAPDAHRHALRPLGPGIAHNCGSVLVWFGVAESSYFPISSALRSFSFSVLSFSLLVTRLSNFSCRSLEIRSLNSLTQENITDTEHVPYM